MLTQGYFINLLYSAHHCDKHVHVPAPVWYVSRPFSSLFNSGINLHAKAVMTSSCLSLAICPKCTVPYEYIVLWPGIIFHWIHFPEITVPNLWKNASRWFNAMCSCIGTKNVFLLYNDVIENFPRHGHSWQTKKHQTVSPEPKCLLTCLL